MNFKEFMNEEKPVTRYFILRIGVMGAFVGSLLTVAFMFITATLQ